MKQFISMHKNSKQWNFLLHRSWKFTRMIFLLLIYYEFRKYDHIFISNFHLCVLFYQSLTENWREANPVITTLATVYTSWLVIPRTVAMSSSFATLLTHTSVPREVIMSSYRRDNSNHYHRKNKNQDQLFIHLYIYWKSNHYKMISSFILFWFDRNSGLVDTYLS